MEYETKMDIIELSRGYLGVLLMAILFATGTVSAIYAGETETYPNDMGIDNLVYAIIGNTTPVYPVVTINSSNITIHLPGDSSPDNFSIIFLENQTKTVIQTINTGGGGSSTRYVNRDVIRDVPRNITSIKEVEILTEVPFETIVEVENIDYKTKFWILVIGVIILLIIEYIEMLRRKKNDDNVNE